MGLEGSSTLSLWRRRQAGRHNRRGPLDPGRQCRRPLGSGEYRSLVWHRMMMKGREAQVAGLNEFARQQKEDSRRRLVEAAERVFDRAGYIATSVDDIAQEAGVSRQTFYRHYDGKLAIAM